MRLAVFRTCNAVNLSCKSVDFYCFIRSSLFLHPLAFFTRINYNAGGHGKGESRKKKKAPTS